MMPLSLAGCLSLALQLGQPTTTELTYSKTPYLLCPDLQGPSINQASILSPENKLYV